MARHADTLSIRSIRRALLVALLTATPAGAAVLSASPALACSPLPGPRLSFYTQDGEVVSRDPFLLVSLGGASLKLEDFTLHHVDTDQDVALELTSLGHERTGFATWGRLHPLQPLEAGSYTLIYETEDYSAPIMAGQPTPLYTKTLSFLVDRSAAHPTMLEVALQWDRMRTGPDDPIFADSCGGSNAEQHRFHIGAPRSCRTYDASYVFHVQLAAGVGATPFDEHLFALNRAAFDQATDLEAIITQTFASSMGKATTPECVRITPYTTSGVQGDTQEICSPTRCGTGPNFPTDAQLPPCNEDGMGPLQLSLSAPYPASHCHLTTQFDPCDGVMCDDGEQCSDGACVPLDPCASLVCGIGQLCVDGECVDPPAPTCASISCAPNEQCIDGACIPDEPAPSCAAITCPQGQRCLDGQCMVDDMPDMEEDLCAAVSCAAGQLCIQGKCYQEVPDETPDMGADMNQAPAPSPSTPSPSGEEEGCHSAPTGKLPAPPLAALLLGAFALFGRRLRSRKNR